MKMVEKWHSVVSSFSALQRAEIAEIVTPMRSYAPANLVSVLFNEPKLLKLEYPHNPKRNYSRFQCSSTSRNCWNGACPVFSLGWWCVSVLFNEPKLLKSTAGGSIMPRASSFSALQRAEIAEMPHEVAERAQWSNCFSARHRAEIAEMIWCFTRVHGVLCFSALQRAEIAEI